MGTGLHRVGAAASALLLGIAVCVAVATVADAAPANGTPLLEETFTGPSVANPNVIPLNDACLTAATAPPPAGSSTLGVCAHRDGTPPNDATGGWLQLTDKTFNRTGGIVYNQALPANAGLQAEFSMWQFGGGQGVGAADGVSFFLVDGSVNLDSVGAYGGSLGYAQKNDAKGVNAGYIGVGLDSYGNFANDSENRGSGCPAGQGSPVPGNQRVPDSIVIRGPMLDNRDSGYCYLTGTVDLSNNTSTLPGSLRNQNLSGALRLIRLTVSPDQFPTVTVEIDFTGSGNSFQTVSTYKMTTAAPLTWKFGFAASTGGGNDVHLVRTPRIQTVEPLPPGINLVKQVDRTQQQPPSYTAGDTVPYQFVVTNTALAPLTNVAVTDPLVTDISCPSTTLGAAGSATASMTCTGSHLLTAAETASTTTFTNTATATGTSSGQTVSSESSVTIPLTELPAIAINKTAELTDGNGNNGADVGETINYSFQVKNAGNVPLTGIGVTDSKLGTVSCPVSTLAPLATATCTGSYTVNQADIDAGLVHNSATSHGTPPTGSQIVSQPSTADVPVVTANSAITIVKTATLHDDAAGTTGLGDLGEHISYSFNVTNAGNVTLTDVAVADPTVGTVTCSPTTLAPAASATCTGPDHIVTAADIETGYVDNTATSSGQPPSGNRITSQPSSARVPTVAANAQLIIVKTATLNETDGDGEAVVGDTVTYTFVVTNVGNVPISAVSVTDANAGPVTCAATTLQPEQSTDCEAAADHTVVQADVDNGSIDNTATAQGTAVTGPIQSTPDTATVPVEKAVPQVTIEKTATLFETDADGLADVGDAINYSFVVTNTGNVTLHDVGVTDSKVGTVACPETTLAPGADTTCTATYTVTQADIDATTGEIVNTATSHGLAPGATDPTVSDPDDAVVPVAGPHPQITIDKHAVLATDANGNQLANVGDTIEYTFTVTNVGNVTLVGVRVTDPRAGTTTCNETTLAPGASTACAADAIYPVVQADIDAGGVHNTATAQGTPPVGAPVTATDSALVPTPVANPRLLLVKEADLSTDANGNDLADVGDEISYTFTVSNIGNVTVSGIVVTDPLAGAVTCDVTTLAPLAHATCTADATHLVTQDDVNAGVITNTAIATGTYAGEAVPSNESTAEVFTSQAAPAIRLDKTAALDDTNGNEVGDVGETISYSFTVHNTGNVTLTGIAVTDPLTGGPITCTATTLDPQVSTTCTAANTYTITQADVDAGDVDNTATATGTTPAPAQVTDNATATVVTTPQQPGLALVKSHVFVTDGGSDGVGDAGDTIQYSFIVTNTGTVTMHDIAVTDTLLSGTITCDDDTLAPGDSTTCAADDLYTVTQADVDAGQINNTATPTGSTPQDEPFTGEPGTDTVTTTEPASSLALSKEGTLDDTNGNRVADVGETIDYAFTVTNNGNVTLTDVAIDDDTAGAVTCTDTTLAPAASTTCNGDTPYTVQQSDVDARGIRNVATAAGADPDQDTVISPPARDAVPTGRRVPAIVLAKLGVIHDVDGPGHVDGAADVGETVSYGFVVFNTGNVTLSVEVNDAQLGVVTCQATSLAPQESTRCAAPDYTVTQADVDNGEITNTATAVGTPSAGPGPVSDDSTEIVPTAGPGGAIVLQKTAVLDDSAGQHPGLAEVGESISYQFIVTNTGNITVHDVAVTDQTVGDVICDVTILAPREQATCASVEPHAVSQQDVDAGKVTNTASSSAVGPGDPGELFESDPATAVVPTGPIEPGIGLSKTAHLTDVGVQNGLADAGDQVLWTFQVVNTGSVTLTEIVISDTRAGAVTCETTTLAPGEATDCRSDAVHTVTLTDVENGPIVNNATASGAPPTGSRVTSPEVQAEVPTPPAVPRLFLLKTATLQDGNGDGRGDVGETISYTFRVVNVGNATATDVHVNDSMFGGPIPCDPSTLKPAPSLAEIGNGEIATCGTHTHTVTESDINAPEQFVHNSAVATGLDLTGGTVESLESVADVPLNRPSPTIGELVLTKTASSATVMVGDTLTYTLTITNTGDALLSGTVTDDLSDVLDDATLLGTPQASAGTVSVSGTTLTWTGSVAGQSVVTITYAVTVDHSGGNGVLDNTAKLGSGGCADGAESCSTSTPVEKELPNTGTPIRDWALLSAGLMLAGAAFALVGRRRRAH